MSIFEWLVKAMDCSDPEVRLAAKVMKDYYQGVSPADNKVITAADRERLERDNRRANRKRFGEEND